MSIWLDCGERISGRVFFGGKMRNIPSQSPNVRQNIARRAGHGFNGRPNRVRYCLSRFGVSSRHHQCFHDIEWQRSSGPSVWRNHRVEGCGCQNGFEWIHTEALGDSAAKDLRCSWRDTTGDSTSKPVAVMGYEDLWLDSEAFEEPGTSIVV